MPSTLNAAKLQATGNGSAPASPGMQKDELTVRQLAHFLRPVSATDRCKYALSRFLSDHGAFALAVIDHAGTPVALLDRKQFVEFFGKLYAPDVYGARSIVDVLALDVFKGNRPVIIEHDCSAGEVGKVILESGGQGFTSGFVITEHGRYLGIGNASELLRKITERNVIALKESEERFRTLVAASAEVVWNVDAQGNPIGENASWCDFTGQSAETAQSGGWSQAVHPEDQLGVQKAAARAVADRVTQETHLRLRRFDGEWRHMRVRGAPVLGAAGEVREWIGYCQDVTEHKQAESSLAQLAAIVEDSNDAIYSRALDGTILTWNTGAERMLGYTAAEAVGNQSDFVLMKDRPSRLRQINESVLRGERITRETRRVTKDGRAIHVVSSHSPIRDADGNIVGVSVMLQDITERKRLEQVRVAAEKRLRESEAFSVSVLDSLNEQVAVLDRHGVIIAVNSSWRDSARANGAPDSVVNPIGVNYLQISNPASSIPAGEESQAAWSGIKSVLSGEQPEFSLEYPSHAPHEQRWFRLGVTSLQGPSPGVVVCHENITLRKLAEERQASLESQLRESQKLQAVGTLAGGIAHDFNNIIATVLGNVELMREEVPGNPRAQESLEEIAKAARRGRELVRQILSFSRRQPVARKPVALAPIIDESARLLRATLPARLSLDINCASDMPLVEADATQIQQVIINLASNAMQAMGNRPGRISVRLDTVLLDATLASAHPELRTLYESRPGRMVRLAVKDTGPGMDKATLARIFEPFFTTKPVGEGTGLGLSVVHGIVQGHEGVIETASQPGQGATFTIYLPAARRTPGVEAPAAGPAKLAAASGEKILYLDDDKSQVFLVKRLLERRGYRVSAHSNQEEALDDLRRDARSFALAVTDYNMPGMSGLDVARRIRTLRADLPVAVTSGFVDEELRTQADEAGVRNIISKADAVEDFCDAVQRLIAAAAKSA